MKTSDLLSKLSFRRATVADLPALVKLLAEDELGKTRESLEPAAMRLYEEAFQKINKDPNHNLMVIEGKGEVIGTVHLTLLPSLTSQGSLRLQIEAVRVAEKLRGEGIGTWMFQQIFKYAEKEGVALIQLATDKKRGRAKKFYESLGFQATHEGMKYTHDE